MYVPLQDLRSLLTSFHTLSSADVEQRLKEMYAQMTGIPFVHPDALDETLDALRAAYIADCANHGVTSDETFNALPYSITNDLAIRVRQMNTLRAEAESTLEQVANYPPFSWYTVKNGGILYGPFASMAEALAVPTTLYPNVGSVTSYRCQMTGAPAVLAANRSSHRSRST